jgi:integrase/recombinase XerD
LQRLAKLAKIPAAATITPHSLRHIAITELLDATDGDQGHARTFAARAPTRVSRCATTATTES